MKTLSALIFSCIAVVSFGQPTNYIQFNRLSTGYTVDNRMWLEEDDTLKIRLSGVTYKIPVVTDLYQFPSFQLKPGATTLPDGDGWWRYWGATHKIQVRINGIIENMATESYVDNAGFITGMGTNGRVTFWTGTKQIAHSSNFTFSNNILGLIGRARFIGNNGQAPLDLVPLANDPDTQLADGQLWYNDTQDAFKGRVNNEYAFMLHTTQGGVMNRLAFFTGQAGITTNENLDFNPSTNELQVPALQVNNINSGSSDNITLSAVGDVVFDPIPIQDDTLKRIAAFDQDGKLRWRDASTLGGFTNSAAANELMLSDGTNAIGSGIIRNADGQFRFGSGSAFLEPGGATSGISLRARGNGNVTITTSEATSETTAHIRLEPGTGAVSDQRGAVIIQKHVISNGTVRPLRLFSNAEGITPGPGDGLGIEYRFDTNGAGNEEIAAAIDVISTDMTSGSEDFDMIFRTMSAGVGPVEKFRVTSDGNMQLQGGQVKNIADPTDAQDAVTLNYLENTFSGDAPTLTSIVDVSSEQFLNSFSSPIQILPAPGPNKYYDVVSVTVFYDFGTTAYDQHGRGFVLCYATGACVNANEVGPVDSGDVDRIIRLRLVQHGTDSNSEASFMINSAIRLSHGGENPTGGDGTFKIIITYKIVDLN